MAKRTTDPYDLIEKLVTLNTGELGAMKVGMGKVESALTQLVQSTSEAKNDFNKLREKIDVIEDQHQAMYNHYFGSDDSGGLAAEHRALKGQVDEWRSQGKVWRWLIGGTSISGFAAGVCSLFKNATIHIP